MFELHLVHHPQITQQTEEGQKGLEIRTKLNGIKPMKTSATCGVWKENSFTNVH